MTWTSAQEAIRLAVAKAVALPDRLGNDAVTYIHEVEWENSRDASLQWGDGPTVALRLGDVESRGTGETRYEFNAGTDKNVPTLNGYRLFTVSVLITSLSQAPGEASVGELAGRLRLRLRGEAAHLLLMAGNVALVRIHPTQNVDQLEINGRMASVSATDVRFSYVESWTDTDDAGDYIARVEGTGEFWGVDEADVRITTTIDVSAPVDP